MRPGAGVRARALVRLDRREVTPLLRHPRDVNHDDRRMVVEPGTPAPKPMTAQVVLAGVALLFILSLLVTQVASCAAPRSGPIPDVQRPETLALHFGGTDRGGRAVTLAQLDRLRVIPSRPDVPGYRRANFGPGLTEIGSDAAPGAYGGNGCRTRADALRAQATRATYVRKGRCTTEVRTATIADPYTGRSLAYTSARASAVQVDHVRALSDAWDSGAAVWSQSQRAAYANDNLNLIATDGRVNASKSDRGPEAWMPAHKPGACIYATRYVQVSGKYRLPVTVAQRDSLRSTIKGACT